MVSSFKGKCQAGTKTMCVEDIKETKDLKDIGDIKDIENIKSIKNIRNIKDDKDLRAIQNLRLGFLELKSMCAEELTILGQHMQLLR